VTAMPQGEWDAQAYAAHSPLQTSEGIALIDALAPQPGERIADLGCGDGRLTAAIAERGAQVVGVDRSAAMVAAARQRGVGAVIADAGAIPLRSGTQDAVFSNAALHWLPDHGRVVAEMTRILAPGGRMVVRTGGAGNQWRTEVAALAVLAEPEYRRHVHGPLRSPWNMAAPGPWTAALLGCNMEVQELELVTQPSGWQSPDDVVRWFETISHPFTAGMPAADARRYVAEVAARTWSAETDRGSFVRLQVRARKVG
jgi:trans-aconitate methyltransferase